MRQLMVIFHGRFPSEKAAGIFADKEAASFAAAGFDVTLVAPKRAGSGELGQRPYKVEYLPTLDLFTVPLLSHIAFRVSYSFFSFAVARWLRKHAQRNAVIISNEALPLLRVARYFPNTLYELHDFPETNL